MKSSNKVLLIAGVAIFVGIVSTIVYTQYHHKSFGDALWGGPSDMMSPFDSDKIRMGDGKMVAVTKSLSSFRGINVAGLVDVVVKRGDKNKLTMRADKNLLPYIRASVKDGQLDIGSHRGINIHPSQPIEVTVISPSLKLSHITMGGKTTLKISNMQTDQLIVDLGGRNSANLSGNIKNATFNLGGKSTLTFKDPDAKSLLFHVGGEADLNLAGTVDNLEIQVGGRSDIMAKKLMAKNVILTGAGYSNLTVHVLQSLNVTAIGRVRLNYYGNPSSIHKTGFGDISIQKVES